MNIVTDQIQESEDKNPQLTAALKEITDLKFTIDRVREIIEIPDNVTVRDDGGPAYTPTTAQLNEGKIEMITNIIF